MAVDAFGMPIRAIVTDGEKINLDDASHILKITTYTSFKVPYVKDGKSTCVVTALDRVGNESKGAKKAVTL